MIGRFLLLATNSTGNTSTDGTIQYVSQEEVSAKFISIANTLYNTIGPVVVPFAKVGLVISILVLLIGGCFSKSARKAGARGIAVTLFVLLFFYLIPMISGYIQTLAK